MFGGSEMAIAEEVKIIVRLLMQRPITEVIALEVEGTEGFEHLEIENGEWVGFDEDEYMGGEEHGWIESLMITLFTTWVLQNKSGRVYSGDTDFVLDGTPDNIRLKRRPDVAYVGGKYVKPSRGYIYAAPDLAVEIISPTERPGQIRTKLREYLSHGVQQVWQVYPENQEIVVYFPDDTSKTYRPGDILSGGDLPPGFELDVANVFAATPKSSS
jgi:Uma2 family endonuclease